MTIRDLYLTDKIDHKLHKLAQIFYFKIRENPCNQWQKIVSTLCGQSYKINLKRL